MLLYSKSGCSSRGTVWFAGRLARTPTCLASGMSEKVPGLHSPCPSLSPPRVGQGTFLSSLGLTGAWGWLLTYAMHGPGAASPGSSQWLHEPSHQPPVEPQATCICPGASVYHFLPPGEEEGTGRFGLEQRAACETHVARHLLQHVHLHPAGSGGCHSLTTCHLSQPGRGCTCNFL